MVKSVPEAFDVLHARLTPSDAESAAAISHRKTIHAALDKSFGVNRFFRTGSFGNGTSVSGFSDVDYFASIPRAKLKRNSGSTLRDVRDVLDDRFPRTGVRVSSPAVLVPFGSKRSEATEVVPADYVGSSEGTSVYEIADGAGGWMRASPELHNKYVTARNRALGSKVKPLVRFVKAWKYLANAPISSFYIELRVAKYSEKENTIIYSIDTRAILKLLLDNGLAAIQDPKGISGLIPACSSSTAKEEALSKLLTAYTRAAKARDAEAAGEVGDAFAWWDKVFFGKFPAFY